MIHNLAHLELLFFLVVVLTFYSHRRRLHRRSRLFEIGEPARSQDPRLGEGPDARHRSARADARARADGDLVASNRWHLRRSAGYQPAGPAKGDHRMSRCRVRGRTVLHRLDWRAVSDH